MPRRNPLADFSLLPDVVTGYELPASLSLVIPIYEDRTNLSDNPSFETNTTNWADDGTGSISRVTEEQFVGAYSLKVTTSSLNAGGASHGNGANINLVAGETYAIGCQFLCNTAGLPFRIHVDTNAGVFMSGRSFVSTGFWQWIWFMHTETSSTNRLFRIGTNGKAAQGKTFYIDAMQIEKTSAGKRYPTTYIDGDQTGLTPGEFPLPYYWNGTPHASTSVRGALTRSGGRVVNLKELGLTIATVVGLGLPTPQSASLLYSQLDGEAFLYTQKQSRTFSLAGRVTGRSAQQLDRLFGGLAQQLDADSGVNREPLLLKYTPMDEEGNQTGSEMDIIATYEGGLEGQRNNLNTEVFTATFKQYFPFMLGHSEGAALTVNTTVSNANCAIRRLYNGDWRSLDTGFGPNPFTVLTFAIHQDGTVYVGGTFTDAGSSGADYAAKYNPITNTISVVKSATAFNNPVLDIAISPDGSVYFAGQFTDVDGIANADGIVKYNPTTDTFSALGTGASAGSSVRSLAFDNSGNLYAGGTFTAMGGVANTNNIAKWDGSVWSALGTGVTGGSDVKVVYVSGNDLFAGGAFTAMGGVANTSKIARWSIPSAAWFSMGNASSTVFDFARGPDGYLYVAGGYTSIGGLSIQFIAKWNGVTFQPVGSPTAFNSTVSKIQFLPNGDLYLAGVFTTINGVSVSDSIAVFNGSYSFISVDLPGSAVVGTIEVDIKSGVLYVGYDKQGSATAEAITTVTHSGTGRTYPVIIIKGPSSGSSRIYSIKNYTTNRAIYMNYTILAGETAILNLDPLNGSMVSDFQGDIARFTILGSDEADFFLVKGDNRIAVLAAGSPTVHAYWRQTYLSVSDAVGKT